MNEGSADPTRLSEIGAKYSLDVIGPVPDGYL